MFKLLFIFLFIATLSRTSQAQTTISTIDFVKVKNNHHPEALFFYENNWKVYRDQAFKKGYIKSYKLLSVLPDSTAGFDFMLITEYTDSLQLQLSETRFQQIIKEIRPNGAKLLNNIKPADFRQNLFFNRAKTLFNSSEKRKKNKP